MANNVFSFKVTAYNTDNDYYSEVCGLGLANTYTEAANYLENYFGDELISIDNITLLEDENLIFLPKKVVEDYKKTEFPSIEYENKIDKEQNL